jgi:hypothetical protein
MKTILQILAVSLVLGSCSTLNQSGKSDIGTYDDVYSTPKDDESVEASKPKEVANNAAPKKTTPSDVSPEPDYKQYKEQPSNNQTGETPYYSDNNQSDNNNDNYYYDDDEDFSYGRSFRRMRYGDGYRDGYNDAMYNSYSYSNDYYYYQFGDPYWGWNRPVRTRFWVGYSQLGRLEWWI